MNIFQAFKAALEGKTIVDSDGILYKNQDGKLVESCDNEKWRESKEFKYGFINEEWFVFEPINPAEIHHQLRIGNRVDQVNYDRRGRVLEILLEGSFAKVHFGLEDEERILPVNYLTKIEG